MKILFLSHYFPPEVNAPASRTYEHCKQWVKMGHDVTVVTCAPNHPRGEVYPGYRNKLFQSEERDGIKVVRLWTYVTANEGFVKRTLNYVSYMVFGDRRLAFSFEGGCRPLNVAAVLQWACWLLCQSSEACPVGTGNSGSVAGIYSGRRC